MLVTSSGVSKSIKASAVEAPLKSYSDAKKAEAISAAATDATSKANAAQAAAISVATTKANAAQAAAISAAATDSTTKANAANAYADGLIAQEVIDRNIAVAAVVDSSPSTLNTLKELAAALGDDVNFATTVSNQIGLKASTSDVNSALALKANSASPSLTGVPTAPTATGGTDTTQIATTAFVKAAVETIPSSVAIAGLDIDWALVPQGGSLYKDVSSNSTFTFSSVVEGKGISVVITNTSGAVVTITLPSIYREAGALTISAGKAVIYTFMRTNAKTYMAQLTNLELV